MALIVHSGTAAADVDSLSTKWREFMGYGSSTTSSTRISTACSGFDSGYTHQSMDWMYGDNLSDLAYWNVSAYDASRMAIGQTLEVDNVWWQVLQIRGHVVTVRRLDGPPAKAVAEEMPPIPGPPADAEPPWWPLWLRETPTPETPLAVMPLEIPARARVLDYPEHRNGEIVDPLTCETPSEATARAQAEVEMRRAVVEQEHVWALEAKRPRWQFWRKAS